MSRDSVFVRVLGDTAERLRPEVLEYVSGPPDGMRAGVGRGVFAVAGSPYRRAAALFRVLTGPDVMLNTFERDVSFTIVNRPVVAGTRVRLEAARSFAFRRGQQRFVDVLEVGAQPGTVVNTLGRAGRVEVLLECTVTPDGGLRMRSRAARVRVGSRVIRLPKWCSVVAESVDGWDALSQQHTISVVVRNPLLGTLVRYRGSFGYAYRA